MLSMQLFTLSVHYERKSPWGYVWVDVSGVNRTLQHIFKVTFSDYFVLLCSRCSIISKQYPVCEKHPLKLRNGYSNVWTRQTHYTSSWKYLAHWCFMRQFPLRIIIRNGSADSIAFASFTVFCFQNMCDFVRGVKCLCTDPCDSFQTKNSNYKNWPGRFALRPLQPDHCSPLNSDKHCLNSIGNKTLVVCCAKIDSKQVEPCVTEHSNVTFTSTIAGLIVISSFRVGGKHHYINESSNEKNSHCTTDSLNGKTAIVW